MAGGEDEESVSSMWHQSEDDDGRTSLMKGATHIGLPPRNLARPISRPICVFPLDAYMEELRTEGS